jgi:hypothetical protein
MKITIVCFNVADQKSSMLDPLMSIICPHSKETLPIIL